MKLRLKMGRLKGRLKNLVPQTIFLLDLLKEYLERSRNLELWFLLSKSQLFKKGWEYWFITFFMSTFWLHPQHSAVSLLPKKSHSYVNVPLVNWLRTKQCTLFLFFSDSPKNVNKLLYWFNGVWAAKRRPNKFAHPHHSNCRLWKIEIDGNLFLAFIYLFIFLFLVLAMYR